MRFNLFKNKEKRLKNNALINSDFNEKSREKFILKAWIESSKRPTCTKGRTRGFLFGSQTPSKMNFSAGRSMVEMLGVLAIIGVLSIGGIQGYTIAMRRYRANEILNVANKYALILYSACQSAIMNDSTHYGYREDYSNNLWIDCPEPVPFAQAGLGGLPSGVVALEKNGEGDVSGLHIRVTDSGDVVFLKITCDSKELCETVKMISGDSSRSKPSYSETDSQDNTDYQEGSFAFVSFIEN